MAVFENKEVRNATLTGGLESGLQYAASGAIAGSAGGPVGALIGAGVGLVVGFAMGAAQEGKAAKEQVDLQAEQDKLARRQAKEQQQLSKELAATGSKGKTPKYSQPSQIMMEAVGGGSGYDAWHSRNFGS